jgi:hypothetical protein
MSIKDNIQKLVSPDKQQNNLNDEEQVEPSPAIIGVAQYQKSSVDNSGSGVDSPLTEQSRVSVSFVEVDQFNVWETLIDVATQITMIDSSGREVIFNYEDPNS